MECTSNRWAVVAVVVAAFAGGLASRALVGVATGEEAAREVRTSRVVFVDETGREIGVIGLREGGYGLMFSDKEGRERITLGYGEDADYYGLRFVDAEGRGRFGCGARGDGKGCGMNMKDENGTMRIGFGVQEHGCGLTLSNADGSEVVGIGAGPAGGGDLTLKHPYDGRVVWQASQHAAQQE